MFGALVGLALTLPFALGPVNSTCVPSSLSDRSPVYVPRSEELPDGSVADCDTAAGDGFAGNGRKDLRVGSLAHAGRGRQRYDSAPGAGRRCGRSRRRRHCHRPCRGAFPGNNGLIAYACGADICVVKADGTGGRTLVATATDPAWSADGLKLAYVKLGVGILVSTVDATGTITGTITTGAAATARHPTWSSGGLKIAYANGGDIWTINADTTGGATNLTQSVVGNDTDPAWSPSGTRIAYASDETGSSEIYTMNVDGPGRRG